jgi:general secretion pathway protein A
VRTFAETEPEPEPGAVAVADTVNGRERPDPSQPAALESRREPAPAVTLAALLESDEVARREPEALSRLLDLWGVPHRPDTDTNCDAIEASYGLRCLRERGTWEDLQLFDRVAALALSHQGRPAWMILTGMNGSDVTLSSRGGVYHLDRARVEKHWSGEYLLLWRAPPRGTHTIAEHSEGVDVLWLRQTLSRVPSLDASDIDNASFDDVLKEKIMTFQRSNDLQVDGKAGVHTIIRLNSIVDPDVPRLQPISEG